ncbi:MAG: glycosyltransferase family 4 protein [Planctomycetes bacterium]|nr:glycosyltransferase family 4 protein [Planctomycetota bacterium]
MAVAGKPGQRLLVITGVFPMEIQPFVTSHVRAMLDRGWTVGVCARRLDRPALAALGWADQLALCRDLTEDAGGLVQARSLRIRWNLWRRFGPGYRARMPSAFSKKLSAQACALMDIARAFAPHALHAHFGSTALVAAPVASRLGVPLLASFHGEEMNHWGTNPHGRLYDGRLDDTTIVVHSRFMQQWISDKCGRKVVMVPFGIDTARFAPRPVPGDWNTPLQIGVIGRLDPLKGQQVALRALRILLDAGVNAHVTLAGNGAARPELDALAASLRLTGHVTFAGQLHQSQVADLLAGLDVVVIPSVIGADGAQETFSLVALEALSRGVPVVASRVGGLPEVIGEGGVLVPPDDPRALSQAVQKLVESSDHAGLHMRALAQAARFNIASMADGYESAVKAATVST